MIRNAVLDDLDTIVELEKKTINTTLGYDLLKSYLTNPLSLVLVLEDKQKIIGYISTIFDGSVCEILNICIEPSMQHNGYGKQILAYIIRKYNYLADSFFLEVRASNKNAIALYEYFDFKQIHVRKNYYKTEDALVYERKVLKLDTLTNSLFNSFCEVTNYEGLEYYSDKENPERYSHNFFYVKGYEDNLEDKILKIAKERKLSHIEVNSYLDINLSFESSKEVSMYAPICLISTIKHAKCNVKLADNDDVLLLSKSIFNNDVAYGEAYALMNLKQTIKFFENGYYKYVIAISKNEVIGLARFIVINRTIYFEDFEVDENYRNKGIGSSLFNMTLEYAKKHNIYDMYLDADDDDTYKLMYEKMGFILGNVKLCYSGKCNGKD